MRLLAFYVAILFANTASGYEVHHHEVMAVKSLEKIHYLEYLPAFGIESLNERIVGTTGQSSTTRTVKSIVDWVRYGANHEDDTISKTPLRYKNHFYDPVTKAGLNYYNIYKGRPSFVWGLENDRDIDGQMYSYKDAMFYFYEYLTRRYPIERKEYLADTFRTLGNVIHLIQDAAQPQHTRNDAHGGEYFLAGEKSLYETHSNIYRDSLEYDGYSNVLMHRPVHYWTTENREGIADYSNRGFISEGTNFDAPNIYKSPTLDFDRKIDVEINDLLEEAKEDTCVYGGGDGLKGTLTFYENTVQDSYLQGVGDLNKRMTTHSIFNEDLDKYNVEVVYFDQYGEEVVTQKLFTLNRFNFCSASALLMPRAVGYSAGFIDYFFRARLFSIISKQGDYDSLEIKNIGDDPLSGDFQLYYNDSNDDRHLLNTKENETIYPKDQAITPSGPNPTTLTFNIASPPDDLNKNEPYVVVFKGDTRFQENDGPVQFEPAVTGFVLDNRKLAYAKSTGDVRKINPETGSAKKHVGQFSGSSRVKRNPLNADLAIVFHPFKNDVEVIDYSLNKTANVTIEPLAARWLVSARWVDGKVMVATLGAHGPTTRYQYKIYRIKPEHTLELEREGNKEIDNGEFEALGGVRSWGHWPGEESKYFDLGYGPYVNWYSFDILPDGKMITLLNKWGWDNTQNSTSQTYYTVLNCTNQVLAIEKSSTTSTFVDMRIQKVGLDGNVVNEDLNTHHDQNYVSEYHYSAPKPPQEPRPCSRGDLSKKVFSDNRDWRYVLHLDVKPNEEIAEVVETGTYTGNQTWTPEAGWIKYDVGTKEYMIDGHQIDTGKYLLVQDGAQNIEEEEGVQFWDLQYDKNGIPFAIWTKERWWFDEPESTYHHDTEVAFGNAQKRNTLLTNRHDYFEYGPPLEYADVVADPYRKGVAAMVKVRDSSFYGEFAYDVEQTEHVRYEGEISVDLRKDYEEEFAGVTSLQFLP